MTPAAKMKKARAFLDNRVVKYIKRYGRRGCRLMNLVFNHGTEKHKCHIPQLIWDDSCLRMGRLGDYPRREYIVTASIKRLKRQGRISCNKQGTPSWVVVPEGEQATTAAKLAFDQRAAKIAKELA